MKCFFPDGLSGVSGIVGGLLAVEFSGFQKTIH
jgi:hypothetical protein